MNVSGLNFTHNFNDGSKYNTHGTSLVPSSSSLGAVTTAYSLNLATQLSHK